MAAFLKKNKVTKLPFQSTKLIKSYNPAGGMETRSSWAFRPPEDNNESTPERRMARSKIAIMVQDLIYASPVPKAEKFWYHNEARKWFFVESDVEYWFEEAGYEWDVVIRKIRDLYAKSKDGMSDIAKRIKLKWRANPGEGKNYEERKRQRDNKKMQVTLTQASLYDRMASGGRCHLKLVKGDDHD